MDLQQLKKHLPHGAIGIIAKKANMNYLEVTRIFKGMQCKKTPIVEKATMEYLEDLKNKALEILEENKNIEAPQALQEAVNMQ